MIQTPQICEIPAIKGNNVLIKTDGDDFMEITVGKETTLVKRSDLYSLVFALGDSKTQDALMPVRQTTVRKFYKQHRVTLKQDLKKGEQMVVNCQIDVPISVEEGLAGLIKRKIRSRFSI